MSKELDALAAMKPQDAAVIREQIAALQAQLAEAETAERNADLETMKSLQRKHRFSQRELGNLFKPRKRGAE